ncbi:MAG: histidine kinase, partial [Bacteroidales bacterium]|nr:histidine kinase [Bacteroidales bacterium]
MISKKLYFNIAVRVSLIAALSILLGYLIFEGKSIRFSILCFATIIILTVNLIYYLNRTNRNIKYFF